MTKMRFLVTEDKVIGLVAAVADVLTYDLNHSAEDALCHKGICTREQCCRCHREDVLREAFRKINDSPIESEG